MLQTAATECHSVCAGAGSYGAWKTRLLLASASGAAIAVTALILVAAQPWWHYAPAALPVLAALEFAASVAAVLLFIIGMAGYGSVHHALEQAADELQHLM